MSAKAIREFDGKHLLAHWLLASPAVVSGFPSTAAAAPSSTSAPEVSSALRHAVAHPRLVQIALDPALGPSSDRAAVENSLEAAFHAAEHAHPWLTSGETKLVAKPDQLIKRRGKGGLLLLNADWSAAKAWISERAGREISVDSVTGVLRTFIIEPFVPHPSDTEFYICIQSHRNGDTILFTHEGGVDVGDVDAKALTLTIPVGAGAPSIETVTRTLLSGVNGASPQKLAVLAEFAIRLYAVYVDLHFTYLEINPLVVVDDAQNPGQSRIYYLDLAAKIDQTAEFEAGSKWTAGRAAILSSSPAAAVGADGGPPLDFPAPFGRELSREEAYIAELDAKTGASLKLTVLNKDGKIWTMVAGGGASVVFSDAIAAHGYAHELANYGEYSGAPSEAQTYEYAKTILDLMTRGSPSPAAESASSSAADGPAPIDGKILFIGGGIANFTNVATTFKGIVRALREYKQALIAHRVRIYVRRAGPNYQEGLRQIRELGETLGVPIYVYGQETHITAIVPLALKNVQPSAKISAVSSKPISIGPQGGNTSSGAATPGGLAGSGIMTPHIARTNSSQQLLNPDKRMAYFSAEDAASAGHPWYLPFTNTSRAIIFGMQPRAVQGMLDFDFICQRKTPSVAAMVYAFSGNHVQKFYWGTQETLVPVFTTMEEALAKFPEVDTIVNFASCRSVYDSTMDILANHSNNIRTVAIIAEGVPERRARMILHEAEQKKVLIIGPATVGGIKPGCFKIGNTGGMMDNIVASKLYRAGSVGYVSKSGGMSNELNNIISSTTDGVYEGVAIGGDRYPGSTFIDHLLRYEADPACKMLVLLGEVGGVEEYKVIEAVRSGTITKPVVAWCIGTCAKMFQTEVQFGHAGALANSDLETADAKNTAMRNAGIIVPETFEDMPAVMAQVYQQLVEQSIIIPAPEPEPPKIPIDYAWAQELGLVRKPASFVSTICDERGQELLYAGMPISQVFKEEIGIGGVVSLLWFKRRLPDYACKFVEMVLMLTADHGPAVSGAHNTIVTARAGKDLISSICSGLLTIGERFGGALDGAAEMFTGAYDKGLTPREFVTSMRRQNKLILGIGHKIKSRTNPDLRVSIIKDFAKKHFPSTPLLDYALAVETITTSKKDNLILNVDGAVGVLFVDLVRGSGAFTREEAEEYCKIGTLNGLFVLGRTIGFIGHYLDQKRLKQGLYRHPHDDISYTNPLDALSRTFVGASTIGK
ncbi:citrate synthase [Ramicandelaber brevisporus]|nr:citrate synthase [Ramicandelaber brevisporus]